MNARGAWWSCVQFVGVLLTAFAYELRGKCTPYRSDHGGAWTMSGLAFKVYLLSSHVLSDREKKRWISIRL